MITTYIQAAMAHAHYEILEDNSFYGKIADFQGVFANANSLEACRNELQEVVRRVETFLLRFHGKLNFGDITHHLFRDP